MQRFQLLTENDITKIHENSLRILEEIGIIFNHEPALEVFKKHGAKVEGKTVFIPKEMVAKALETTPSSFTLYSRNSERNVEFDTVKPHFCGPGGSAYIRDLDNGRRRSTKADFINLSSSSSLWILSKCTMYPAKWVMLTRISATKKLSTRP